jgi:hypothetical protein
MAHFAKLNNSSIVTEVLVIDNSKLIENGVESEAKGIEFLTNLTGHSNWKQCSYNTFQGTHLLNGTPFRINYPILNEYRYDAGLDGFVQNQKPYESWIFNNTTGIYEPPIAAPDSINRYYWDESTISWVQQNPNT